MECWIATLHGSKKAELHQVFSLIPVVSCMCQAEELPEKITVNSSGGLSILSSGIAENIIVNSYGELTVLERGACRKSGRP